MEFYCEWTLPAGIIITTETHFLGNNDYSRLNNEIISNYSYSIVNRFFIDFFSFLFFLSIFLDGLPTRIIRTDHLFIELSPKKTGIYLPAWVYWFWNNEVEIKRKCFSNVPIDCFSCIQLLTFETKRSYSRSHESTNVWWSIAISIGIRTNCKWTAIFENKLIIWFCSRPALLVIVFPCLAKQSVLGLT